MTALACGGSACLKKVPLDKSPNGLILGTPGAGKSFTANAVLSREDAGVDVSRLQAQIETIEEKRAKLIELYMAGDVTRDEYGAARAKCDSEIEELRAVIAGIESKETMRNEKQTLLQDIEMSVQEILAGVKYEDEFYKQLLDKMVVNDRDNIDVYINLLPLKWSYTLAKAGAIRNIFDTEVPISVSELCQMLASQTIVTPVVPLGQLVSLTNAVFVTKKS